MAKFYAIKSPKNGDFRYFRKKRSDTVSAFVASKEFGDTWSSLHAAGYRVVTVDIRVLSEES